MALPRTVCLAALGAALLACGARTPLRIPALDAAPDALADAGNDALAPADSTDAQDAGPDVPLDVRCADPVVTLLPKPADLLFVLDRSGSMAWNLAGSPGVPSRWQLVRDALAATLPSYDGAMSMGAMLFPSTNSAMGDNCFVDPMAVDVPVAPNHASAILALMRAQSPTGLTPTRDALVAARGYFAGQPASDHARNVVLATDGGPNCNTMLDGNTCTCSVPGLCRPDLCLDDQRTLAAVAQLAADGVPTYVIGIAATGQPLLESLLDRVALAGGRPNRGTHAYYSVRTSGDVATAFDTIQRVVAACVFRVPDVVRAAGGVGVTVSADGVVLPQDTTRANGWALTAPDELSVFGPACDMLRGRTAVVQARVACERD